MMRDYAVGFVCLLATACAGGTGQPKETDLEAAFCDLLENGPEVDVIATDNDNGPELLADGRKVEILLIEGTDGMYSGRGRFTPDETGSFAMGLGDDVPISVMDSAGNVLGWDAEVAGAACADLAIRYTVTLDLQTYVVAFGPTSVEEVDFVSEESDDDL